MWFRKAADRGDRDAQFAMGLIFMRGLDVAHDEVAAARMLQLAADQGHSAAQCELAECLMHGYGVPQDTRTALRWMCASSKQGSEDARANLCKYLEDEDVLALFASDRELSWMCCPGCGETRKLRVCSGCKVARFCTPACIKHTWKVHKPHCKAWVDADEG